MAKKPEPFHNPFKGLKLQKEEPKKAPPPKPVAPPPPKKAAPTHADEEAELFLRAVGAVEQVRKGAPRVEKAQASAAELAARVRNEDDEVLEQLALLVGGTGSFDLADSSEFIEGAITGLDRKILTRLRRGDYPVQARLDLHGMIKEQAKKALEDFILGSRRLGKRCVLVVHGRGLHSPDEIPVLKAGVQQWLSQGRVAREVIAFCSARPNDGGAGAVYVLLRS